MDEQLLMDARKYAAPIAVKVMGRHFDDAEDILQNATLKAITHNQSFRGESSFRTWFTRIVINEALMHLRKFKGKEFISLDVRDEDGQVLDFPAPDPSPERQAFSAELRGILQDEIMKLSPARRQEAYLMLCGVKIERNNSTRKTRRHCARHDLRNGLEAKGIKLSCSS